RQLQTLHASFSMAIRAGPFRIVDLNVPRDGFSSMLDKSDESLTRVYNALANPTRRQIVQILKERGKAGFKELHDTLRISVGALYHHLDSLEGFVAQGADRKYVLTDDG